MDRFVEISHRIVDRHIPTAYVQPLIEEEPKIPVNGNLNDALQKIVEDDKLESMNFLLSRGYKVKVFNEDKQQTLIHLAYYNNSTNILKDSLIFENCEEDINYTDTSGLSHLHIACVANNMQVIRHFLQKGEDINQCCSTNGYTPLHFAVEYECWETVKFLLESGANVGAMDAHGKTPMHLATRLSDLLCKTIRRMQNPREKRQPKNYALRIMDTLVKYNCPINARDRYGRTPLFQLFLKGTYSVFDVENTLDTFLYGVSKMSIIIRGLQKDRLELLLKNNADVRIKSNNGDTVLHWLVQNLEPSRVPRCHTEIDFDDKFHVQMAKLLIYNGVEVNALDNRGRSALQYAVHYMSVDLVKLLLDNGADVGCLKLEAFPQAFKHPNIYPTLEAVENIMDILEILEEKDFELERTDHLAILDFFVFNNDYCMFDDKKNSYFEFYNMACFATPFGIFRSLDRMSADVREKIEKDLGYMFSKFVYIYLDKELVERFNIKPRELLDLHRNDIVKMQEIMLNNKVSLYDVLKMNPNRIFQYLRNREYRKIMKNLNLKYFGHLVEGHFAKALIRNYVVKASTSYLKCLSGVNLPDPCCEMILNHIDNEYMWAMCSAAVDS